MRRLRSFLPAVLVSLGVAAPAAAQSDLRLSDPALCADPLASCGVGVTQGCLLRLGAGSLAAGAPADPVCEAELGAYRDCLSRLAESCPRPDSAPAPDARSPRERLTAMGRGFDVESFMAAAKDDDREALALFAEARFLGAPARACDVLLRLIVGVVAGEIEHLAAAFPADFLAAPDCAAHIPEEIGLAQLRLDRYGIAAPASPAHALVLDRCLTFEGFFFEGRCERSVFVAHIATRADLEALVAPQRARLEQTRRVLADPARRAELCVAFFAGEPRLDVESVDVLAAAAGGGLGDGVFGSTTDLVQHGFDTGAVGARPFCEAGVPADRFARAMRNVERAEAALDRLVALGR